MGVGYSSLPLSTATQHNSFPLTTFPSETKSNSVPKSIFSSNPTKKDGTFNTYLHKFAFFPTTQFPICVLHARVGPLRCGRVRDMEILEEIDSKRAWDVRSIDQDLIQKLTYDALVWSSLHGLVIGDKSIRRSGKVPGIGMNHAPFALLPLPFPESHFSEACELAPIFNELIDRVSLDAKFLQESLSRTKKVDAFTSRLLDIHSRMIEMNKKEDIRLGLHRSDYMLCEQTKSLLQIELNTISCSFPGFSSLVSELHRSLLIHHGKLLGLDSKRVPLNSTVSKFAEALAKAWTEFNNPRAVVMVVVSSEERNMYDQHWLFSVLREKHNVTTIRKTLAEVDEEGELLPDGTLVVGGQVIAVVYFRGAYAPIDFPSETEWRARLLVEQSTAIKSPSVSYHLAGTKKIQQELTKPNVLERFLDNKEDVARVRKCFAGLWSLDDPEIVNKAIERPDLYIVKPQREGGGNNIYGDDVRKTLLRLKGERIEEGAAYVLMQRIFPSVSLTPLIQDGICHEDDTISELGIYSTYIRNNEKVIMNEQSGYLMRTKISSSNEGGVAAGYAVLDSVYLT
ncbi:Glutathione synthetase [Melia azedarach]|uniref:Glutathione synthetase n=1 Tax=Melia azedarach TaxID=155640 RepID=A0ACC1Y729_MELAZ|nr:Glutathione synthetase [Melia azedarach]